MNVREATKGSDLSLAFPASKHRLKVRRGKSLFDHHLVSRGLPRHWFRSGLKAQETSKYVIFVFPETESLTSGFASERFPFISVRSRQDQYIYSD
jgi:hypothetical protein